MLKRLTHLLSIPTGQPQAGVFVLFVLAVVLSIWAGIGLNMLWLGLAPAGLVVLWVLLLDFRKIYFLMLAGIAVSTEISLPGGLGTDLPSEPLMWLLTASAAAWFLRNWRTINARFIKHPIALALFVHLAWMTVCMMESQDFMVSFKFMLAKSWYLIVFFFLTGYILRQANDFKMFVWWFFVPLLVAVSIVLVRHAAIGFSFKEVEYVMAPFFRNHVMYACSLAIFLPFLWYCTYWYKRYSKPWYLLVFGIVVFLVAINFAYTRAAYVALVAAIGIYWFIRWRMLKVALIASALFFALFIGFVKSGDNWLEFAPDYERTISHKRFESLLTATTRLEDISIMERVYRWVAAGNMIKDRPYMGFGPGTFYFFYKNYTVTSFKTYVSGNPEHSGIHNYYLMTTVEQGIPGLVIFLAFCLITMLYGERIYHQTKEAWRRRMLIAAVLSFILIDLLMLMNDFVETDKIGSFFFMCAAIIINVDLLNRQDRAREAATEPGEELPDNTLN